MAKDSAYQAPELRLLPLTLSKLKCCYIVKRIVGKGEVVRHLNTLGLLEGGTIRVMVESGGNYIIAVKESRLAIGHSIAQKIILQAKGAAATSTSRKDSTIGEEH